MFRLERSRGGGRMMLMQVLARDSTQGEVQIPRLVSVGRVNGEPVFLV